MGAARAKIVAVDDDPDILSLIEAECSDEGHLVTLVQDSREAISTIHAVKPDVVLLDLIMPHHAGDEICRQIRAAPGIASAWIIILSAKDREHDIVQGLDAGADDYLTKPLGMGELVARIRSMLRRRAKALGDEETVHQGPLMIDRGRHLIELSGQSLELTPAQFRLLEHLASHPGRVFSRESLLVLVSGSQSEVAPRTVDAHIKTLRLKLGESRSLLETVRGIGYRWIDSA